MSGCLQINKKGVKHWLAYDASNHATALVSKFSACPAPMDGDEGNSQKLSWSVEIAGNVTSSVAIFG